VSLRAIKKSFAPNRLASVLPIVLGGPPPVLDLHNLFTRMIDETRTHTYVQLALNLLCEKLTNCGSSLCYS
jgi:hypothetical protein